MEIGKFYLITERTKEERLHWFETGTLVKINKLTDAGLAAFVMNSIGVEQLVYPVDLEETDKTF